jgi:hypothetical protein
MNSAMSGYKGQTMTTQQARDEFLNLIYDDHNFAEIYQPTPEGFQSWLDDYSIGLDD